MAETSEPVTYELRVSDEITDADGWVYGFSLNWTHNNRPVGFLMQGVKHEEIARRIALEDPSATCWWTQGACWKTKDAALAARDRIMIAIKS